MRMTFPNRETIMCKSCVVLIAVSGWLAFAVQAQVTNVPSTELETFEARTGTVIIKGVGQVGSMAIGNLNLAVINRESTDVSTGRKQYGLTVEITESK